MKATLPLTALAAALLSSACRSLPAVRLIKPALDPDTGALQLGVQIGGSPPAADPVVDYTDPKAPVDIDASEWPEPLSSWAGP